MHIVENNKIQNACLIFIEVESLAQQTKLENDYGESIQMLAISSNSLITHPQDGAAFLANQANAFGWSFLQTN